MGLAYDLPLLAVPEQHHEACPLHPAPFSWNPLIVLCPPPLVDIPSRCPRELGMPYSAEVFSRSFHAQEARSTPFTSQSLPSFSSCTVLDGPAGIIPAPACALWGTLSFLVLVQLVDPLSPAVHYSNTDLAGTEHETRTVLSFNSASFSLSPLAFLSPVPR